MSPLAVGMDVLLAALLAAALFVGARLNGRLAALKESQDGFARAVGELNAAAARADSALKALRAASEETHDALLDRIETARSLIGRLEQAGAAAERTKRRAEAGGAGRLPSQEEAVGRGAGEDLLEPAPRPRAPRAAPPPPRVSAAALPSGGAGRDLPTGEPTARPPLRRTLSELLAARGRAGSEPLPARAAPPPSSPPPPPRRRPLQDEDLFVDLDEGAADRSERRGART
jgi:hypothetical protein